MLGDGFDIDQRILRVSRSNLPDDIFNRGYPELVVREMASGKATTPAFPRARGRKIGGFSENPTGARGIELQNEVAEFLADEGYLVNSLGPRTGSRRMEVYEAVDYNRDDDPDLVIWQALPDGTYEPRYFDIYSPVTVKVNTLEREIRKKAGKQGGHIVLNLQRTALSVAELNELQRTLRRRQNRHLREVVILNLVGESADGVKVYEFAEIWTFSPAG